MIDNQHYVVFPISAIFDSLPGLASGVFTDGYDTLTKAALVEGHFFVLYAADDRMMPKR